ncbi:MAG: fumarylacetoacetate hydrolase family protein [Alphaproteobacteria bacterium]|nr:fumarylacetoacetate hydrolase family protein [Alphaproteobacteria bacterium]
MTDDRVSRAASLLLAARKSGKGTAFPEDIRPRNMDEVYAIQSAVAREIGPIQGWKTGAPSPEAEAAYAPIFTVVPSPASFPAAGQKLFGIEAEVAFRFARNLPRRGTPYTRADIIAAIASAHPVIELVDTRFADWKSTDALSKVADFQSNAALIYGAEIPGWQDLELVRPPITITANGAPLGKTKGNSGGDPLRLVTDLANHCAATGEGLRAGTMVTSGSITGIDFAKAGDKVVADFGRLGTVRVDLPTA